MSERKIKTLYEHYKNTPKKLKIICDWDEVIQPHEPYAYFEVWKPKKSEKEQQEQFFPKYFKAFWDNGERLPIKYSNYGSHYKEIGTGSVNFRNEVMEYKNSPDFYQQAPFLTIAEDLLKLIKEDKVEKLIFLSAYDKRKFPAFDGRKIEIFHKTFNPVKVPDADKLKKNDFPKMAEMTFDNIEMRLIPFESETQGQSKADWIKQNAPDFDIVIDDNPKICNSLVAKWFCKECLSRQEKWYEENKGKSAFFVPCENCIPMRTVISPYYPATAKIATGKQEGYYRDVLLVKQEVSDLKKEDFSK